MPDSPKVIIEKTNLMMSAWEQLRPGKRFASMTAAEFRAKLAPMQETRKRIATLQSELAAAIVERNEADRAARRVIQWVVNAVRADIEEGEDGALYEAMGYIAKGNRKTGLTRKRKPKQPRDV